MTNVAPPFSSSDAVRVSRLRVIGACTSYAAIFTLSTLALTSVLPTPAATYLKHIFLCAMVILATGANVYSENFNNGWRDKAVWAVMASGFSAVYIATQASINGDLVGPKSYVSTYVLVTIAIMISVSCISSIIVRKSVWNGFRLWGARPPQ